MDFGHPCCWIIRSILYFVNLVPNILNSCYIYIVKLIINVKG